MDRRTKILASVFGVFIAYALASGVVYPRWIEPLLTIDQTIAQREEYLAQLQEVEAKVREAKWEYKEFSQRVGSFDTGEVEHDLRERLNDLIEKRGLEETSVGVHHSNPDRKTNLERMTITVSATGTLESAVLFLKDLAELPHVLSVTNPTISPTSSARRRRRTTNLVKLSVPLEIWVLPQQRILGRIQWRSEPIAQPDSWVRHEDRDYSVIWEREPLWPPVRLDPLVARIKDVTAEEGEPAFLEVSVRGGDGDYSISWERSDGLASPEKARTAVDTSMLGTREYMVTVTDGSGHTATATGRVIVCEKGEETVEIDDQPRGPQRWRDGRHMQLTMALIRREGAERFGEVMVHNGKSRKTDYYTVSDEFDGGEVVFVHQTGALVRRQDEYFVYPIGAKLTEDIAVDEAVDYPRLQEVARYLREAGRLQEEPEMESAQSSASGAGSTERSTESAGVQTTEGDLEQGSVAGSPSKSAADQTDKPKSGDAPARVTEERGRKTPPAGRKSSAGKGRQKRRPPARAGSRRRPPRNVKKREKKD